MKVERELCPRMGLEEFADQHGLTLQVTERAMDDYQRRNNIPRFVAHFKGVEVASAGILSSTYGDGNTEHEAIANYAKAISTKTLVVNAYKSDRVEIPRVPHLSYAP